MDEDRFQKFIDFALYCPQCQHADAKETDDPCNECLTHPARSDGSKKPINFKEKK